MASNTVGAAGAFGADIEGLEPNLTYEVRAVATNALISHSSPVVEPTTLPIAFLSATVAPCPEIAKSRSPMARS